MGPPKNPRKYYFSPEEIGGEFKRIADEQRAIVNKCEAENLPLPPLEERLSDKDIKILLSQYAVDTRLELYAMGEACCVPAGTMSALVKSDKWKPYYMMACERRGEQYLSEAMNAAEMPIREWEKGKEISPAFVKGCALSFTAKKWMAQVMSERFFAKDPQNHMGGGQQINILVNTGVKKQ